LRKKNEDEEQTIAGNPYRNSSILVETRFENLIENTKINELSPLKVLELFEKIPDYDVYFLNMNPRFVKPKHLIVTQILVPPVCIRPTVELTNGKTNEDDLTIKIYEILRANKTIRKLMEEGKDNARFFLKKFINFINTSHIFF